MLKRRFRYIYCFLLLLALSSGTTASARTPRQEIDYLIQQTKDALYTNPNQAKYYARQVLELLPEEGLNDSRAKVLYYQSQAEKFLGNFDAGLQTLYDAQECVTPDNQALQGRILAQMASFYTKLNDYARAVEINEKAILTFQNIQDSIAIANCYNDRGIIHYFQNEFYTAEQFLQKALELNRSLNNQPGIAANLNNLCLYEGDFNEKIQYINEAIAINRPNNQVWSLGENYNNMGKQYFYAHQYEKALKALTTAYQYAHSIQARELICDNYEYSAWVYEAIGNYRKAYECLTRLFELSKSLQQTNKVRAIEQEIAQKRYLKHQREAQLKEQAYEIELLQRNIYLLIVALLLSCALGFFVYKWYKRRKNMQLMEARYHLEQSEHELAELKVRQQELELQAVQQALDNSRQEATSFAVFLQSRNEMLEKIRNQIKEGYKMDLPTLIPHLKKVSAFINQCQSSDKNSTPLLTNIDDKNREFLQRLNERHPNLTQGERHLATLLRVNLSTKEIAMLTGNAPKTINMNRYRLRKALDLSSEEDLTDYLQSI